MDSIPRKSHKKSRSGCSTCKTRKIKCDETHPICFNCSRRRIVCSYPAFSSTNTREKLKSEPIKKNLLSEYEAVTEINLQLISYIFNDLYLVLTSDPVEQQTWKTFIGELFHKNPSLKHSLMAIASLHKYYSDQTEYQSYLAISQYHHSKCLGMFKDNLNPSTFEETTGSLCVSLLLTIYLAASSEYKIYQVSFFKMVQGVDVMFQIALHNYKELYTHINRVIIDKYTPRAYGYKVGEEQISSPKYLRELCSVQPFENAIEVSPDLKAEDGFDFSISVPLHNGELLYHQVYAMSIEHILRQHIFLYNHIDDDKDYLPIIIRWVLSIPKELEPLLSQNDPRALIIVAHFIKILLGIETIWWRSTAVNEFEEVKEKLPIEWRQWFDSRVVD